MLGHSWRYTVTSLMRKSRYDTVYFMRTKSEEPEAFAKFYNEVKTIPGAKDKVLIVTIEASIEMLELIQSTNSSESSKG